MIKRKEYTFFIYYHLHLRAYLLNTLNLHCSKKVDRIYSPYFEIFSLLEQYLHRNEPQKSSEICASCDPE